MKIEINNQITVTIGVVFSLLIIECLMSVFKVNYIINISSNIALCIFFNIFNYKRFSDFQTEKDLQVTNIRLGFSLLLMNLIFIISTITILIRIY